MEITPIDVLLKPPDIGELERSNGLLDKEDFLLLLVTQMRFQNPLDPLKNQEFASQLAQFSSLEQLTNLNETMEKSQIANSALTQTVANTFASNLIGKRVLAQDSRFVHISPTSDVMQYILTDAAASTKIQVKTKVGNVLIVKDLGAQPKGVHQFVWDGIDQNGHLVADGEYLFEVIAEGSDGSDVAGAALTAGFVQAVRFHGGTAFLVVNDVEIPMSGIEEIVAEQPVSGQ